MIQTFPVVNRSGQFMLYFQAIGVCEALRLAIQTGQLPGPSSIALVKEMKAGARIVAKGDPIDRLPDINEQSSLVDILVTAEVIRTTMLAFLSPEEVEDQERTFGFASRQGKRSEQS